MYLIGLMSGTSADGIDAVLVDIHGRGRRTRLRLLKFACLPHAPAMRAAILRLCDPAAGRTPDLCALNAALGERFAEGARAVAEEAGIALSEIAAIGSHGQTVWHQPQTCEIGGVSARGTIQIGEAAIIAERTGCPVVSGFRAADMAAGGQGAPLVPYFDWAVLTSGREARAVQNIGGIANVTHLPRGADIDDVLAFDTGPGNMVIDALMRTLSGGECAFDPDGAWAAAGCVDRGLLSDLLRDNYFQRDPPKSTGRERFGAPYTTSLLRAGRKRGIGDRDLVATATALTVESIALAYERWLTPRGGARTVIVGGGGARNLTVMAWLAERLSPARITSHEEFGIPDDAKEAVAFALLAYETLHGRPSNVPSATGASRPVVLGSITRSGAPPGSSCRSG